MDSNIQLIVGLGNPGTEYEHTRHNAGADFVQEIANQLTASLKPEKKFFGLFAQANINGHTVKLLIPTTFMNRSGQSVAAVATFYKIPPQNILVAHDELDLPPGTARLKLGGGHGGHNGLRDIIQALGNCKDFARLRLGIGHPGNAKLVSNFVLKKAPPSEFDKTLDASAASTRIIPDLVAGQWNQAMKELHTAPP